jgi:benzoyl-CoA reductase/2-hydroxyglutaryl-CoA dehydratase subunit BcrC/BadD/HgdB
VEAYKVRNFLRDRFDLPSLHIETDYSEADAEQLKVRIEAFLEMVGG